MNRYSDHGVCDQRRGGSSGASSSMTMTGHRCSSSMVAWCMQLQRDGLEACTRASLGYERRGEHPAAALAAQSAVLLLQPGVLQQWGGTYLGPALELRTQSTRAGKEMHSWQRCFVGGPFQHAILPRSFTLYTIS